jgi:hypothetical protein
MFSSRSGRSSDLLVMVDAVDDVTYWHKADIEDPPVNVRFWTKADKVAFGPRTACPLMTQSGDSKLFGRRHHAEPDEHSKLIAADPFFSDFSIANAEHCKRRRSLKDAR